MEQLNVQQMVHVVFIYLLSDCVRRNTLDFCLAHTERIVGVGCDPFLLVQADIKE